MRYVMTRIEINVLISLKHSLQITAQMKKKSSYS